MRKILLALLIVLPFYLLISLYFLDKEYFVCPVDYQKGIIIRCDGRGNGFFAAERRGNRIHEGLDLFADIGTPVRVARSGRVTKVDKNNGMGNYIVVAHPNNIITR